MIRKIRRAVTKDVWRLEQQVTGGELGDPEEFVNELFQARHGLLAVRTMAALSAAIYGRMATLQRVSPDGRVLVADMADQFDQVRSVADGEKDYLQGVIDFYQTVLTLRATLATQAQNEEVGQLTQASYAQNEEIKKISAWAAILFAPTLVGTIYGMNFEHMPELNWILGYPAALVLGLLTSVVLYTVFKRAVGCEAGRRRPGFDQRGRRTWLVPLDECSALLQTTEDVAKAATTSRFSPQNGVCALAAAWRSRGH